MRRVVKDISLGCTESLGCLVPPLWPLSGWHEGRGGTSSECAGNLQHHCWQVPELTSRQGKRSNGGRLYCWCQAEGRASAGFPQRAQCTWAGQGCCCCDRGGARAWRRGSKGQTELHGAWGSVGDSTGGECGSCWPQLVEKHLEL